MLSSSTAIHWGPSGTPSKGIRSTSPRRTFISAVPADLTRYFASVKSLVSPSLQVIAADIVIVWRLWVVWGKKWSVALFPVIMIIGEAISGYGAASQFLLHPPKYEAAVNWATAMYAISLATNVIVTTVTTIRIWYMSYHNRGLLWRKENPYLRVILLIVESGGFLAAAKVIEFGLYRASANVSLGGDHSLRIVLEAMPQVMGMIPTIIVHVVNSGFTRKDEFYTNTANTNGLDISFAPNNEIPTTATAMTSSECEETASGSKKTPVGTPLYPVQPVRVFEETFTS